LDVSAKQILANNKGDKNNKKNFNLIIKNNPKFGISIDERVSFPLCMNKNNVSVLSQHGSNIINNHNICGTLSLINLLRNENLILQIVFLES